MACLQVEIIFCGYIYNFWVLHQDLMVEIKSRCIFKCIFFPFYVMFLFLAKSIFLFFVLFVFLTRLFLLKIYVHMGKIKLHQESKIAYRSVEKILFSFTVVLIISLFCCKSRDIFKFCQGFFKRIEVH